MSYDQNIFQGKATQLCRFPFDLGKFQKQDWAQRYMASPFQASRIIELKDSIISCSKALLRQVVLDLPRCITVYLRLYPQLLFLCLSTYTQTFPPYWGVLVLASVLV